MKNLVSRNPLQVHIGVQILCEVSKSTNAFDKNIRLAFIKRLKELPADLQGRTVISMRHNRLSYAQYILRWLIDKVEKHGKADLSGMDCRYQEFPNSKKKLKLADITDIAGIVKIRGQLKPGITFAHANCIGIDFRGVDLCNSDFTGLNTMGADKELDLWGYHKKDTTCVPKGIGKQQWGGVRADNNGNFSMELECEPLTIGPKELVEVWIEKNFIEK